MGKILPTELVGSYALPSWLHIAIERIEHQADLGETIFAKRWTTR
jgi:hypothetical protein